MEEITLEEAFAILGIEDSPYTNMDKALWATIPPRVKLCVTCRATGCEDESHEHKWVVIPIHNA